jgi:hypothetical protein
MVTNITFSWNTNQSLCKNPIATPRLGALLSINIANL